MKNNKKGFTLIELLVVIAIIGLLATLSVIALNTARMKARDARRVSDVKQIQTALEMYFDSYSSYPADINWLKGGTNTTTFMTTIPVNPSPQNDSGCTVQNYTYNRTADISTYTLRYCLSDQTAKNANFATATPAGIK